MKKIPTLFERVYENHKIIDILPNVPKELECVLRGECVPTIKFDGSCCAIIDGKFYKRYDAKKGKTPPEDSIPCCEPDPITGHHPHWAPVSFDNPADKWFVQSLINFYRIPMSQISLLPYYLKKIQGETTFEAVGPHFQNNPYDLPYDTLIPHGSLVITDLINKKLNFDIIKDFLENNYIEGIVFWKNGKPLCKIKRSDFGFEWNNKKGGTKI